MVHELTSLNALWPFLHYCKTVAAVKKKNGVQVLGRKKDTVDHKYPFLRTAELPQGTQLTSARKSLATPGSHGYSQEAGQPSVLLPLPTLQVSEAGTKGLGMGTAPASQWGLPGTQRSGWPEPGLQSTSEAGVDAPPPGATNRACETQSGNYTHGTRNEC